MCVTSGPGTVWGLLCSHPAYANRTLWPPAACVSFSHFTNLLSLYDGEGFVSCCFFHELCPLSSGGEGVGTWSSESWAGVRAERQEPEMLGGLWMVYTLSDYEVISLLGKWDTCQSLSCIVELVLCRYCMIQLIYGYKVRFLCDQAEALVQSLLVFPCLRNNYRLLSVLNHKSFCSCQPVIWED